MIRDSDSPATVETGLRVAQAVSRLGQALRRAVAHLRPAFADGRHRWWLGLAGLAVLLAAWPHVSGPRVPVRSGIVPSGREAQVARRPLIEDVFYLTGELKAARPLEIVVPQGATWQAQIKWLAEDGAELKQGDPLVEFDNASAAQAIEELRLLVTQAEIALDSRERSLVAERDKKRAALELAEIEEQKARLEAEVPDSLRSRKEWHQKQSELHDRQAALAKARRDLTTFEVTSRAEIENLRLALAKARRALAASEEAARALAVHAPRPGILVVAPHWQYWAEERKLQVGDTLYPGMLVASIPDLSEMIVEALLPEVDEGRVVVGQPARCVLDTYPDRTFAGAVTYVVAIAEQGRERSGFRVRVALEQTDPALMRPGMSVRMEIVRATWRDALVVPRASVEWRDGRAFVTRARGGGAVELRLRACTPTECVLESGLSEGERVVV